MKRSAKLARIENNCPVTKKDREFLYCFQNSVLLALKQEGVLTETQYRRAEDKLNRQRREQADND